ncbi:MAG TPA: succinyl-diaminopimelate desuccinylase [Acidimicrobiales bacterium]|nr:succinyl-diaminopimelate desuccinylase [Acidimicrobiales bacterium]
MVDLLQRTAELVAVASVSLDEGRLADIVEAELRGITGLEVDRVGDNVVARTALGRSTRLVLAGHLDTVPPNGNADPRIDGDTLWGVGSADMKGGLVVMLTLAHEVPTPGVDVTWVFYTGEEIASTHNGLGHLFRDRPDLVAGDVAILGEPTDGLIEAGCQGSLRVAITLAGRRAHTARPWMGRNAIHRAGRLLTALESYEARRPVLDGCEFRESMEAVAIEGGVAGNVVPDRVTITVNVRFAPDRSAEQAEQGLRDLCGDLLEPDDEWKVVDVASAAPPGLDHPVLAGLRDGGALGVRAKLGWTDVARFAAAGIPAANFGPGDPTLAHTPEERVERASLDTTYRALLALLTDGAAR